MSTDQDKRQVRIFNSKTGESRLSQPVPVHSSREATETAPTPMQTATPAGEPALLSDDAATMREAQRSDAVSAQSTLSGAETGPPPSAPVATGPVSATAPTDVPSLKVKPEIATLEQFIAHVYARKGQRVALKSKVERAISENPRLDEGAMTRLMALASADTLLAVPRQLLLVGRDIEGFPSLRAALNSFVMNVMLRHPAYSSPSSQASLTASPDAPSLGEALSAVAAFQPAKEQGKEGLKPAELQTVRRNAVHLLATWWACQRGLGLDELTGLLQKVLWTPAAQELVDENARLRALTEIDQPAALGVVSHRLRQEATEARSAQERAERAVQVSQAKADELEVQLETARAQFEALTSQFADFRARAEEQRATLRQQQDAERMHLRHELEQLRGRLVRRLNDSVEMLEVGLTALRSKTPRTEVMAERAEHVVDAMRTELGNLKED
jgi:hypothetical protein